MNPPKSGFVSSEFWLTLATQAVALLVLLKVIAFSDQATVEAALKDGIVAIGALVAQAITLWKYIQSRTEQKVVAENVKLAEATSQVALADAEAAKAELEMSKLEQK